MPRPGQRSNLDNPDTYTGLPAEMESALADDRDPFRGTILRRIIDIKMLPSGMNGRKLVAWNLRRLRVERGFSQERLAGEADIDRTYVGRLERVLENPTVGILEKLAGALSVPITEFFVEPPSGFIKIPPLPGGPAGARGRAAKSKKR
jgi:DNA-binding XRE family transcriptional regulator